MTRRERQKALNQLYEMAADAEQIGKQLTALAARIKSEADSARKGCGSSKRAAQKGAFEELLLKYKANLTK